MSSFPVLRTRLPVRFLSSFPVSLPQLFHRCFPSLPLPLVRFSSGLSACFLLSFVCFCSLLTTQPSALSFPFFPISPGSGSLGALRFLTSPLFSSSVRPVSMPSFRFRYSASCVSFLRFTVSCHRHYAAPGLLFPARPFPFAFALGSGYLACLFELFGSPQTSHILPLEYQKVNTYFVHLSTIMLHFAVKFCHIITFGIFR